MSNKEAWDIVLRNYQNLIKVREAVYSDVSAYHQGESEAMQIVHDTLMLYEGSDK